MEALRFTYLSDILHIIAQALLVPVVIGLLAFIGYAIFCIGSLIAETIVTHREFKVAMPEFLSDIGTSKEDKIPEVIAQSGLLNRQKVALLTLWDYRTLADEPYVALAKRLLSNENLRYARISGRNDAAAKLSPMLGLMGTLIPLGPGIAAMGQGQLDTLAISLNVAFDTTVAGLVAAFVCFIIAKIRKNRYKGYMVALESSMTTLIDRVSELREAGELDANEPTDFARRYVDAIGGRSPKDELAARKIAKAVADSESESEAAEQTEVIESVDEALEVVDSTHASERSGE